MVEIDKKENSEANLLMDLIDCSKESLKYHQSQKNKHYQMDSYSFKASSNNLNFSICTPSTYLV